MKKIGFDFQFRSSAELAKQFQIKTEKLTNERENRGVKEQAPLTHIRKNPMPVISNSGEGKCSRRLIQSEESVQQEGRSRLAVHNSTIQSPLDKNPVNASHVIAGSQGKRETQFGTQELQPGKRLKKKSVSPATCLGPSLEKQGIQLGGEKQIHNQLVDNVRSMPSHLINESIQQGRSRLTMHKSTIQQSAREEFNTPHRIARLQGEGENMLDIQEQQKCEKVKRKSVLPATSLGLLLEKQGIHLSGEEQPHSQPVDNSRSMPSPLVEEHHFEMDGFAAEEEVDEDEYVGDEAMDNDCATGSSEKKKVRGKTKLKKIHTRKFEEREEVTFDKGQAAGPTDKRVSDLSNFIGTIARNPKFITLLYTSWHTVPDDIKERMWDYVNSKFIIPAEGKKWVMEGLRDAWKRHKRHIKMNHFEGYETIEDMLENRPGEIPEVQFRQLIEYWKLPDVQARCHLNSQNRKKQKWRHRMGPRNFARVRVALRATKENNEEPSQSEMFIATRTKEGKQVQADSQIAISELQSRQNSGESPDDAFKAVFGKEQPGRVRCYGRSVTTSSLKKDEEINKLTQKHNNEVSGLKEEVQGMREEMQELRKLRHCFALLVHNNPGLNVQDIPWFAGSNQPSPVDANSAGAVRGQNHPRSSGSTHGPILEKENVDDAIGGGGL